MKTGPPFFPLVFGLMMVFAFQPAHAVSNPDAILWRTPDVTAFVNSLYTGLFGRAPTPEEMAFWTTQRDLRQPRGRGEAFTTLATSAEYNAMFGSPPRDYEIRFKTRWRDTENGRTLCHCYFFTKDPSLTGGHLPVMQYTHVNTYWNNLSFDIARALIRMYALYDSQTCPALDCGYGRDDLLGDRNPDGRGGNLVKNPNFTQFGSGGAWGTGLYSQYGIWWNSKNADTTARTIRLAPDRRPPGSNISTALEIRNRSGLAPHVYGTTSQRIRTIPGTRYEISLWASGRNLASGGAVYVVVDPEWKVRPISLDPGAFGWKRFQGSFTARDAYVDLRIISADRGTAYITGVSMIPQ